MFFMDAVISVSLDGIEAGPDDMPDVLADALEYVAVRIRQGRTDGPALGGTFAVSWEV